MRIPSDAIDVHRLQPDDRYVGVHSVNDALLVWLLAACSVFLAGLVFLPAIEGRVLAQDDLGEYHLPTRFFYAESLARNADPTWCPDLFCGYYLHGEGQVGMLHPVHLMLYLTLPLSLAFMVELTIAYPVIVMGMAIWMRRQRFAWSSSILAGLVLAYSGFCFTRIVHTNAIQIMAHIPWILWCLSELVSHGMSKRFFASYAVLHASICLLGYPQYVVITLLTELIYLLVLIREQINGSKENQNRLKLLGRTGLVALAISLGCMMAAAQLVPTWDVLTDSQRATPNLKFLSHGSLNPMNWLQIVNPWTFKDRVFPEFEFQSWQAHEFAIHSSTAMCVLIIWGVFCARCPDMPRFIRRRLLLGFVLIGMGVVLSAGRHSPLFPVIARIPILGLFRCSARYSFFAALGMCLCATCVWELALRGFITKHIQRSGVRVIALLSLGIIGLKLFTKMPFSNINWMGHSNAIGVGLASLWLAALLIQVSMWRTRMGLGLLALLCTIELGGLQNDFLEPAVTIESERPDERPVTGRDLTDNRHLLNGVGIVDAYTGLKPRKKLTAESIRSRMILGVEQNTTAFVGHRKRCWLLDDWAVSSSPQSDLDLMSDHEFERIVLVDNPIDKFSPGDDSRVMDGRVRVARRDNFVIDLEIEVNKPSILVVSESFHEGWNALIDNEGTKILRAYGDLMSIPVDAGTHHVELLWRPTSLRGGLHISIAAGCAMGLLLLLHVAWPRSDARNKGIRPGTGPD